MLSLVVTDSGEARIISSDSETTSGGALQFWRRDSLGDLRLIAAWAPGSWKGTRQISREEADLLIGSGLAEGEKHEGHHPAAPAPQPRSPRSESPEAPPARPEGWRHRYLGRDSAGRKLTVMHGSKGFFVKAVLPDESAVMADLPKGANPQAITLVEAEQVVAAKIQRQLRRGAR